ncbi:hypothetical protein [Paenibacillus sp. 1P03SA]|uniref:hypothetical protein n=1 Tax=Paenibacillus sp. 1P03SA TaxID=3132294 RepID=UPI0039A2F0B8
MKEAVITDTLGVFQETTLVTDDVVGVLPIYASPPEPEAEPEDRRELASPTPEESREKTMQEPILVGYRIAVPITPGLYLPKWDFESESWIEALSSEDIAELTKPRPVEPTPTDTKVADLEAENKELSKRLADIELAMAEIFAV